jgi:hypothetical protein
LAEVLVLFTWENQFSVFVFRLDGTVQALNAEAETPDQPILDAFAALSRRTRTGID